MEVLFLSHCSSSLVWQWEIADGWHGVESYKIKENWKGKRWFSRAKWISMFYVIKPCQAMSKCWHTVSTNNVWGLDRLSNEFSSLFRKTCNSAAQRILHTKLALPWYKKEMRKKKDFQRKKNHRPVARMYMAKRFSLMNPERELNLILCQGCKTVSVSHTK